MAFCINCGHQLADGAKFCFECGARVDQNLTKVPNTDLGKSQERRQSFVGEILKCPHCGSSITDRTVICANCGNEITGRAANTTVQAFKDQLMAIEETRQDSWGTMLGFSAHKSDVQKLSLIRAYPIPNTIDDILEFVLLAVNNIDVSLSKNTAMNRMQANKSIETSATIGRTISNAWVAKLQEAYRRAEMLFSNHPEFKKIQEIYLSKMKELKLLR